MSFLEQLSHIYNKNPKYGYDFEHLDLDMAADFSWFEIV